MPNHKWLYVSDYDRWGSLYSDCLYYYCRGYRVFVQGYSAIDCLEFIPPSHYHYVRWNAGYSL